MIGKCASNFEDALDPQTESLDPLMFVYPNSGCFKFGGWIAEFPDRALIASKEPAIGQALSSMGIPIEFAGKYVDALEAGSYIIFVHATSHELRRVKEALSNTPATSVKSFSTRGLVRTFGLPLTLESHG